MQSTITTSPNYSFNVVQQGDMHVFTYWRAKYGIKLYFILAFVLLIPLFIGFWLMTQSLFWAVTLAILSPIGLYLSLNARKSGTFNIDPTHIHVRNKSYDRKHIHEIYYDLPKPFNNDTVYFHGSSTQQLKEETRLAVLKETAAKNFIVGFVYGEKHIKLAGGLTETGAEILYRKITAILNQQGQEMY